MKKLAFFLCPFICHQLYAQQRWPAVTQESRPWTRWWWMGSAVDTAGINWQISELSKAGFGGVEIVPVYGVKGNESNYITYLSPAWIKMLDYTVATAAKANMGVYMAAGTGWPIGGPQVRIKDAATKLIIEKYTCSSQQPFTQKIVPDTTNHDATLAALVAYDHRGKAENITGKVSADGSLQWHPAVQDSYTLYAAFNGKTRQLVKRAAPGGAGFTLDHFSATALRDYLKTFDTVFTKDLRSVKAFYNDSYEVFGADWTPGFFDAFLRRRGYDLRSYIKQFDSNNINDTVARIKSDYRETMADLLLNNFTDVFSNWAHSKHALSLNQAHGSPGNLLDLYASADIPECETFGSGYFAIPGLRSGKAASGNADPDPVMLKFASSAAHMTGKKLVSCETFTWLGEHFKTSWSQCKPQVEQVFLSGVNHMFYHGTTYSPQHAAWPGWLFYASLNIVPANSLWPHIAALNSYITRCQAVLQQGQPDNEIAVYWPVYDLWHNAAGKDMPFRVHDVNEWLHPTPFYKLVNALQQQGYATDFCSDKMLAAFSVSNKAFIAPGKTSYKFMIVPQASFIPEKSLQHIWTLVKNGGTLIMQSTQYNEPGLKYSDKKNDISQLPGVHFTTLTNGLKIAAIGKGRLIVSADISQALQYLGLNGETVAATGLQFIRRKTTTGKYYYIVNHTDHLIDSLLPLNYNAVNALFMDPQTGRVGTWAVKHTGGKSYVRLRLLPGEAIIVQLTHTPVKAPAWYYAIPGKKNMLLHQPWQLSFKEGGPSLPEERSLQQIIPWTALGDTACNYFSGTGVYSTSFTIDSLAQGYQLAIDSVYESARVMINGYDAGIIWSVPYKLDVSPFIRKGENNISIAVTNLMANRIRYMDQKKISRQSYHEINFVNMDYKPFDASGWNVMPSGLAGNVWLNEMENGNGEW